MGLKLQHHTLSGLVASLRYDVESQKYNTYYFIIKHFNYYIILNLVLNFMRRAAISVLGVRKISPAAVNV